MSNAPMPLVLPIDYSTGKNAMREISSVKDEVLQMLYPTKVARVIHYRKQSELVVRLSDTVIAVSDELLKLPAGRIARTIAGELDIEVQEDEIEEEPKLSAIERTAAALAGVKRVQTRSEKRREALPMRSLAAGPNYLLASIPPPNPVQGKPIITKATYMPRNVIEHEIEEVAEITFDDLTVPQLMQEYIDCEQRMRDLQEALIVRMGGTLPAAEEEAVQEIAEEEPEEIVEVKKTKKAVQGCKVCGDRRAMLKWGKCSSCRPPKPGAAPAAGSPTVPTIETAADLLEVEDDSDLELL